MKKAYLVTLEPMTRVVVETDGKDNETIEIEAIELAIEKMRSNVNEYLQFCQATDVREDVECPAQENE